MFKKIKIIDVATIAIIAAMYVILNTCLSSISFGPLQLRLACILHLLCIYNRKHIYACVLGTMIANIFSPFGLIDVCFGFIASSLACTIFYILRKKNKILTSLLAAVVVGIVIGFELYLMYNSALVVLIASVFVGQFIVYCVGCFIIPKIVKIAKKLRE